MTNEQNENTTCNGCKYAEWYKTKAGYLHPSGDGKCGYEYKVPPLPTALYWIGSPPIPSGQYIINRRQKYRKYKGHCPYWTTNAPADPVLDTNHDLSNVDIERTSEDCKQIASQEETVKKQEETTDKNLAKLNREENVLNRLLEAVEEQRDVVREIQEEPPDENLNNIRNDVSRPRRLSREENALNRLLADVEEQKDVVRKIQTKLHAGKAVETACSALESCQKAVRKILLDLLDGSDKALRTEDGFVRWGLVENRILETIETHWSGEKT